MKRASAAVLLAVLACGPEGDEQIDRALPAPRIHPECETPREREPMLLRAPMPQPARHTRFAPPSDAGSLDSTFAHDGRLTLDTSRSIWEIAEAGDGSILVVGGVDDPLDSAPASMVLCRLRADGDVASEFGEDGCVFDVFGANWAFGTAVEMTADGILVAGMYEAPGDEYPQRRAFLARYSDDGDRDPAFGAGGMITVDRSPEYDAVDDIFVNEDGILLQMRSAEQDYIVRFTHDGRIDTSFGEQGFLLFQARTETTSASSLEDSVLTDSGDVIALVRDGIYGQQALFAYGRDGHPARAFALCGSLPLPEGYQMIAADGDDLVLAGPWMSFARLDPNGWMTEALEGLDLDPAPFPGSAYLHPEEIVVGENGAITFGGTIWVGDDAAVPYRLAIGRRLRSGELDPSFGSGGVADFGPGGAHDLKVLKDGRMIVLGLHSSEDPPVREQYILRVLN